MGISYLEIYNEVLTDLSNWKKDSRLEILDGLKGQRGIIRGIHVEPVQNTEEAWQSVIRPHFVIHSSGWRLADSGANK